MAIDDNGKKHPPITGGLGSASRQSARNVLREKIRRAHIQVETLETLERVILWDELTENEEAKLWDYFISRRD